MLKWLSSSGSQDRNQSSEGAAVPAAMIFMAHLDAGASAHDEPQGVYRGCFALQRKTGGWLGAGSFKCLGAAWFMVLQHTPVSICSSSCVEQPSFPFCQEESTLQPAGHCCAHTCTKLVQTSSKHREKPLSLRDSEKTTKMDRNAVFHLILAYKTFPQGLSQLKVLPEIMAVALRKAKIPLWLYPHFLRWYHNHTALVYLNLVPQINSREICTLLLLILYFPSTNG